MRKRAEGSGSTAASSFERAPMLAGRGTVYSRRFGRGLEKVEEGLGKTLMEGDKGRRPEMAGIAAEATSAQLSSTRAGREGEREWKQGSSEGIGSMAGLRIRMCAVR